jgi:DNA-binding CsgD family transcriptional regulator
MEDLQIAYDLFVIMIGFAALTIAILWAVKTGEAYLRDFCILYALFTFVLVNLVVRKYLFLNVESYSARAWYFFSGVDLVLSYAVIVALIHFLGGVYQIRYRRAVSAGFLVMMLVADVLLLSPIGAVLDSEQETIHLGIGYQIASLVYFASFTFAMLLGYGRLRRLWNTERRNFVLGLLIFATVGYLESAANIVPSLQTTVVSFSQEESGFLYSSIPYALYGIFLINYFLHYPLPAPLADGELSDAFMTKYGITDREREIILKVIEGKSNSQIADELFISLATVKTHLHNIYGKMNVDSRYDLLARVRSGQ